MTATRAFFGLTFLLAAVLFLGSGFANAQRDVGARDASATRAAMERALTQGQAAQKRGEALETRAREASEAVDKTAARSAALAARIQQAEAGIAAAEARIELIDGQRGQLDRRLAIRRQPLMRLTGALQRMARRPVALSVLKPGSLRETVYLHAMLDSTLPRIRARTATLRAEIERERDLERDAAQALAVLRQNEDALANRRKQLAALETRQRLASRSTGGAAARESERALALAEEVRDLDAFIGELDQAGDLRAELAALPGPMLRPGQQGRRADRIAATGTRSSNAPSRLRFQLPVAGRIVSGFRATAETGIRNDGITLAPRDGAQAVAPAGGRVAFAGPYRGYGRIVIIEHRGGWTSLVTGLGRIDVRVGERLVAGSPLGIAGVSSPRVTLELRRSGTPVNPLDHIR